MADWKAIEAGVRAGDIDFVPWDDIWDLPEAEFDHAVSTLRALGFSAAGGNGLGFESQKRVFERADGWFVIKPGPDGWAMSRKTDG
jgi:hypothetical protein